MRRRSVTLALLLIALLLILQLQRRIGQTLVHRQGEHEDTLAIMELTLSMAGRAARDWGHWGEAYRFALGSNPDFRRRSLEPAALFESGAIMVMLRRDGSPLLVHADPRLRLPGHRSLIQCVREQRGRLSSIRSLVRLACTGDKGSLYVGAATSISDDSGTAPANGTLALLDPLLKREYRPSIRRRLETLRRDLVLISGTARRGPSHVDPIQPPIHGRGTTLLAIRRPDGLSLLGHALWEELPVLGSIPLLALLLRAVPMLRRRRLRILQRRLERRANQRIRRTCRELDQLLESLLQADPATDDRSRILGRLSWEADSGDGGSCPPSEAPLSERQLERVSRRFQNFLDNASRLALLDSLTQLPNRRYFLERVGDVAARESQRGQTFALLFIDLDRFKRINDTYGHEVGDRVLVGVSERLRGLLVGDDFLARYGGDELAIILDLSDLKDPSRERLRQVAHDRAQAMVEALEPPVMVGDLPIAVSLSIGITLVEPGERDPVAVIQRSDLAMYQAKRRRDRPIITPVESDSDRLIDSHELFSDLIQAIHSHQLQIFLQAIVDGAGQPRAVEALARWRHPQQGWIEPLVFLEMAAQNHRTQQLGNELIRTCLDGYRTLWQLRPDLQLYLNITPAQLLQQDLSGRILTQLRDLALPPQQITIELTEHGVLEPCRDVRINLEQLREAGMRLALDDFGTGTSSLMLLKTLRPDVVKIDKGFIQAIEHDGEAQLIVSLIADLAARLQLELIAEGIENQSSISLLRDLGIERFQGYAFGRPRPLRDWLGEEAIPGRDASRAMT